METKTLTVHEGNRLIAKFLGFTPHSNDVYAVELPTYAGFDFVREMKFHSDWNWLIPVCEKCAQRYEIDYKNDDDSVLILSSLEAHTLNYDKDGCYRKVVEYIDYFYKHLDKS